MPGISDVRHLGDYIREQRASSQISLRQLAKLAGVSNPYLSQIERGLRKPSAEILQQIAKGLRVSAEAMYVQAGILEHREGSPVVDAVLADAGLTERQKQVLLEIHDSFRKENAAGLAATARLEAEQELADQALPETAGDAAGGLVGEPDSGRSGSNGKARKDAKAPGPNGKATTQTSTPAASASAPRRPRTARTTPTPEPRQEGTP